MLLYPSKGESFRRSFLRSLSTTELPYHTLPDSRPIQISLTTAVETSLRYGWRGRTLKAGKPAFVEEIYDLLLSTSAAWWGGFLDLLLPAFFSDSHVAAVWSGGIVANNSWFDNASIHLDAISRDAYPNWNVDCILDFWPPQSCGSKKCSIRSTVRSSVAHVTQHMH